MGTILSEEITKRAGGSYGEFRGVGDYVEMISAIGRRPVERSTDYRTKRPIGVAGDNSDNTYGPTLGPRAYGTPMLKPADEMLAADD